MPSELLKDFFLGVANKGAAVVSEYHLLRWSGQGTVTPVFWQIMVEHCQEALVFTGQQDDGYRLYVGETDETYTFMIWDGLDQQEGGWWQSVAQLAEQA